MKPLPDDLALANDQGSDHGIWACCSTAPCRQAKGHDHEVKIVLCTGHRLLGREVDGLRATLDFFPAGFAFEAAIAACAAASRAIATRKGEQLT